ncbi:MAG: hypothetical protein FWG21_05235 [Oscillospiraceae bacterium]|nr:hypothetical protein [Oscillospiraceae bacterium]
MSNVTEPIVCTSCGAVNTEGAFCINCGTALPTAPAAQPQTYQPTYTQPAYQPAPTVVTPVPIQEPPATTQVNGIKGYNSKWNYTPIKPWGYFGLNILFSIPLVGLVFLLVFSLGGTKKINLRNYARSYFCGLLLVLIVVILLLIFGSALMAYIGDFSFDYSLF